MTSLEAELLYCAAAEYFAWRPSIPVLGAHHLPTPNQRLGRFPTITGSEAQRRVCKNCLLLSHYSILLDKRPQGSRPRDLDYSFSTFYIFKDSVVTARDTKNQNCSGM